jgi:hypothetical protein
MHAPEHHSEPLPIATEQAHTEAALFPIQHSGAITVANNSQQK